MEGSSGPGVRGGSGRSDDQTRYRLLFENMHTGLALHEIVLDDQGLPRDYRFLEVNPAFEELTGLRAEAVVGKSALQVLPGLEPSWIERYGDVALTGRPQRFEDYSSELGRYYEVSAFSPAPGQFATLFSDITSRKLTAQALQAAEERYRSLVESSPNAIAVHRKGRIVYVNPAGVKLIGAKSQEELIGRNLMDFVHPDYQEVVTRRAAAAYTRGEVAPLLEEKFVRLDGSEVDVEVVAIPLMLEGEPAVNTIIRDITGRKRAEEALRESEEKLRQGQRLEAIGRLAGGVAHDFNNLLTAIIGHTEFLRADVAPHSDRTSDLDEIQKAAERAATLTRQLLAFSRRQALQPHVFDLDEVTENMTGLLEQLIGEDVHLAFRQSPDLWPVEADPGQIEQVIMNLAINARDAMPEGGKLTVETANVELNEDYVSTHLATEPGPYVMLAVSDTGCGMSRELLSHIFEPFFTTKDPGKGTGLGLSTVYGILKQSGGSIWVYSEPGKGTTFKVYLPRADKPVDWSPRSRATPDGASRDGDETILLVEDEPAVLRLAARVLASRGYVVFTAGSPEEAITLFREHPGRVHLLLTDVILPGMSGHALAEVLTGEQSQAPRVLYMSGYTRNAIVHEGRLDADIEFLEKPFTPEALARRVREVLDMPVAAPPTFPA